LIDITRTGEPDAEAVVTVIPLLPNMPATRTTTLVVDGRTVGSVTGDVDSRDHNVPVIGPEVIAAMASGHVLEVSMDAVTARLSLRGSAAAFRYIDEKQGRAGTSTALVARGSRSPSTIRTPPPVPQIRALPVTDIVAEPLTPDEQARARVAAACRDVDGRYASVSALSVVHSLVLVPCGGGPVSFRYVALVATGNAGARTFERAIFDTPPRPGIEPVLYNARWMEGLLSSDHFATKASTCGSSSSYAWDGARFRQVAFRSMWVCNRAAVTNISLWRATVVRE
jgi:hypothetical protein